MVGRNELCPCGSGKKYKKCCMNKEIISNRIQKKVNLVRENYSSVYEKLYQYSMNKEFEDDRKKANNNFYIIDDEELNSNMEVFFNTYFMFDYLISEKKLLIESFIEKNANKISKNQQTILTGMLNSYVSLFEIKEKNETNVKLVEQFTKEEYEIDDIELLKSFTICEKLIARPVKIADTTLLIDITLSITSQVSEQIVNEVNSIYEKYKDVFSDLKTFLYYQSLMMYKYIQQLLEPKVAEYLFKQVQDLKEKEENAKENLSDSKNTDETKEENTEESKVENTDETKKEVAVTETKVEDTEQIKEENTTETKEENTEKEKNIAESKKESTEKNSDSTEKVLKLLEENVDSEYKQECIDFAKEIFNSIEVKNRTEVGWAAGIEYYIKKKHFSRVVQVDVARKYNISANTVRTRYKLLENI
ncbi:MAG: SEC-C domain-containing protein [Clostridioides sp.]|jgi:hypothetical protein|nr:SEC-C domain-containing protein [Clostridioides sp.]